MKRLYKLLCPILACLLLFTACKTQAGRCDGDDEITVPHTFTDSMGFSVSVERTDRVAVLFSSLADVWLLAGGKLAVTVGETVERGFASAEEALLVDDGAGKTVNTEVLIAAAPDFVITSADIPAQREAAALLRQAGIPVAEMRLESFGDYLSVLKTFTDLTGDAEAYATYGIAQKERIDALVAKKPLDGMKILFIRAGSSARSVKAKSSADHFASAMLTELGAINIADTAPLLADGLSMEVILAEDPDYIFFTAMGDEQSSAAFVEQMLQEDVWQGLSAVQRKDHRYLPKELFHYKPCARWAEAYEQLAQAERGN